jgi:hypothetical protein
MTADQFADWLQGFAELNAEPPSAEQWQSIRDHLNVVSTKATPNRSYKNPINDGAIWADPNSSAARALAEQSRTIC